MQAGTDEDKPCLVETGRGLSVLYKNRYLYSKYNPVASIERLVESVEIQQDSLILCLSPVLGYGLERLAKRLPENCFMLAIESDPQLLELYNPTTIPAGVGFLGAEKTGELYNLLTRKSQLADNQVPIPSPGTFRHCLRLDFSAATALHQEEYLAIHRIAELAVANFWKNRLTLIKMGRLYHRNIIRNLALLPHGRAIPAERVDRPLLVLGAGPSADETIQQLERLSPDCRKQICLLAVDAAVPALLTRKIKPDLVLALECQHAIQQAYTTAIGTQLLFLADLTSRPSILHEDTGFQRAAGKNNRLQPIFGRNCTGGETAFFSTEFASTSFLERLQRKGLLEYRLPPLGSVGIAAVELAVRMRTNSGVPILVSGLDFSHSLGRTHCKESFQVRNNLTRCSRLNPPGSYGSLSNPTLEKRSGKSGPIYSDHILRQYAQIFLHRFQDTANIYDVGGAGLDLGLQKMDFESAWKLLVPAQDGKSDGAAGARKPDKKRQPDKGDEGLAGLVEEFYRGEEALLQELRDGLSQGAIPKERILAILEEADYLYLHFPDGHRPSLETSFLKRVRSEIDFFLKDIAIGRRLLAGR